MRFRFWAWLHDIFGAIEMAAERLRLRAVRGMADATEWGPPLTDEERAAGDDWGDR